MEFHQTARKIFEDANKNALQHHHKFVTPEHVLRTILDQHPDIYNDVDEKMIIKTIDEYLDENIPIAIKEPVESAAFRAMANHAAQCTMNGGYDEINLSDILAGIWNTKCQASMILKECKITKDDTIKAAQKLKEMNDIDQDGCISIVYEKAGACSVKWMSQSQWHDIRITKTCTGISIKVDTRRKKPLTKY
jgi:ATP-dependent Clp protease ATP-binding subunit ClpA